MKGYKALHRDFSAYDDFKYEIGKTYELPKEKKLEICKCGFHFCKNPIDVYGYYPNADNTIIVEVEALGDIVSDGTKYATNKIKIVRIYDKEGLMKLISKSTDTGSTLNYSNTGEYNTGKFNSGSYNVGNYNSGDYNTGLRNSGKGNSGSDNVGICNTGNHNSGDFNSGHGNDGCNNAGNCNKGSYNTGGYNDGNYNTGNYNSGTDNSGNHNSGNHNTGYFNSGDCNTGYFNAGCHNTGIFNSDEPHLMRAFNKECNISFGEFLNSLDYSFYSLCDRIYDKSLLLPEDKERIEALPNYDPEIFTKITGIDLELKSNEEEETNIVDVGNTDELIASLINEVKSLREEIKQLKNKEE